jgi:hypothetical protein
MYNFLDLACEEFHGHGLTIIHDWMVWCKTCRLQVRSAWVGGEQELELDDILVGGNVISRSDKIWEHRCPARSVDRVYFESDRYPRMESRQPCQKFISALSMSLLFCMALRKLRADVWFTTSSLLGDIIRSIPSLRAHLHAYTRPRHLPPTGNTAWSHKSVTQASPAHR